jgi:O-antigen/teichoic acid export membrane protein
MHLFKTILRTVFTKGASSVISFLIVILTARYMGAEGRGEISLIVLNITLILLVNDLIGGAALVFLVPRYKLYSLLIPAWIWGVLCGFVFPGLFYVFGSVTQKEYLCLSALSIFLNLSSINSIVLNGKEKIKENNLVSVVQVVTLLVCLAIFIFFLNHRTPFSYYLALLASYGISFGLSLFFLRKEIIVAPIRHLGRLIRQMSRSGFYVQLGNTVQLLNYRLGFYLIDHFFPHVGKAMVGVYATGTSVCESVWVISNGISMVQYARISNMKDRKHAQELTVSLSKISFLATLAVMIVLVLLPSDLFRFIFGPDFAGLPSILLTLSAGITAFGLTCIYSHYFSGIGKMHISSYSSVVGFAITLVAGFLLVPRYGIQGAAMTACASYLASALYLLVRFHMESGYSYVDLLLRYKNLFSSIKNRGYDVRN